MSLISLRGYDKISSLEDVFICPRASSKVMYGNEKVDPVSLKIQLNLFSFPYFFMYSKFPLNIMLLLTSYFNSNFLRCLESWTYNNSLDIYYFNACWNQLNFVTFVPFCQLHRGAFYICCHSLSD